MKLVLIAIRFSFPYLVLLASQQVMAQNFDFGEILKQAVQGALNISPDKQDASVQNFQAPEISNAKELTNQPMGIHEQELFAGNDLITSIQWPTETEKLGFKSLTLGDEFDLQGRFVYAYTAEMDSLDLEAKPFACHFIDPEPIASCKVLLWSGSSFPQNIADLNTAFGAPVNIKFRILLSRAPTIADIGANRFGRGRIFDIEISNQTSNQAFIDTVVEFFTKKFNFQPEIRKTYNKPAEIYSKRCLESNSRIAKIPTSSLSLNDKTELKKCEAEAAFVIFSGKAFSGSNSTYKWRLSDKPYMVTLTSSEASISNGTGGYVTSENIAKITIERSAAAQIDAYSVKLKNIRGEQAATEQKAKKADF